MTTTNNAKENEMNALDIHPFEKAGLGIAPFRFVGMSEKVYVACQGAPEQPAGTCDYCSTGIRYCCHIVSADGKEFIVGQDCVRKTDRDSLLNAVEKAMAEVNRKNRAAKRQVVRDREQARINAALALLDNPEVSDELQATPHPFESLAKDGKSYLDYIEYMRRWGGHSGLIKVSKVIESLAAAEKVSVMS